MTDYVVAGLKLTPVDATFTEARDAILAAAAAARPEDLALLAAAFARRGAGSCAVSPPRDSYDFVGVVESYDLKPQVLVGSYTLDDGLQSCDGNGLLDAGERGTLRLQVVNASFVPAASTTITVTSPTAGISFPAGATVNVGPLVPFGTATAAVEVALDRGITAMQLLRLDVSATNADACRPKLEVPLMFRANFEEQAAASAIDDVEGQSTVWITDGEEASAVWSRLEEVPGNHVWRGLDLGRPSDSWLESPDLPVGTTEPFRLSFRHKHDFETADEDRGTVYYDGAVIEITSDGGATWEDISIYIDPGYGGIIDNSSGNPLADRPGFVGRNRAWPRMESVTLDLGTAFAGKTVRVRFHIGTDQAAGGPGWLLDEIGFEGIGTTPFSRLAERPSLCPAPVPVDGGASPGATNPAAPQGRGCSAAAGTARGTLMAVWLAAVALLWRRSARRRRPGACPPSRLGGVVPAREAPRRPRMPAVRRHHAAGNTNPR
jgi:hypothetical protein